MIKRSLLTLLAALAAPLALSAADVALTRSESAVRDFQAFCDTLVAAEALLKLWEELAGGEVALSASYKDSHSRCT